jgi:membrane protein implicated in regulation of membrane protease activity
VILRFLLLNECELSLKVLVLVINVALAYTAVPLLRRRRRRRRRRARRGGGGRGGVVARKSGVGPRVRVWCW